MSPPDQGVLKILPRKLCNSHRYPKSQSYQRYRKPTIEPGEIEASDLKYQGMNRSVDDINTIRNFAKLSQCDKTKDPSQDLLGATQNTNHRKNEEYSN
jgi:hypothetical protein